MKLQTQVRQDRILKLAALGAKHLPIAVHKAAAEAAAAKAGVADEARSLAAEEKEIVNGTIPAVKDNGGDGGREQ